MSDAKPATDAEVAEWKRGIHHVVADFDSMNLSLKVAARIAADAAEIKRLRKALESLVDVQRFATGWDNGVTDGTGTINEGDHWHGIAMDRAVAALGGRDE